MDLMYFDENTEIFHLYIYRRVKHKFHVRFWIRDLSNDQPTSTRTPSLPSVRCGFDSRYPLSISLLYMNHKFGYAPSSLRALRNLKLRSTFSEIVRDGGGKRRLKVLGLLFSLRGGTGNWTSGPPSDGGKNDFNFLTSWLNCRQKIDLSPSLPWRRTLFERVELHWTLLYWVVRHSLLFLENLTQARQRRSK